MKDDNSIDEKKPAPRLRRIGDIGINLFAPLAETRWMLRSCRHMLDQHKTRLKRLMPDRQPESPVCMTWEEAVRASGLTVDELDLASATSQDVLADRILADDDTGTSAVWYGPCGHRTAGHHPDTYPGLPVTDEYHCSTVCLKSPDCVIPPLAVE